MSIKDAVRQTLAYLKKQNQIILHATNHSIQSESDLFVNFSAL